MEELLGRQVPMVVPGEIPSRANIDLNYKLRNVPAHRITNAALRSKKLRWDSSNNWKDVASLLLRSHVAKYSGGAAPLGQSVAVAMRIVFPYQKAGEKKHLGKLGPQHLKRDMDNVEKAIFDAVAGSLVIADDCQVIAKIVHKSITTDPKEARLEIWSIARVTTDDDLLQWHWHVMAAMGVEQAFGTTPRAMPQAQ